jgi:hypothetical protein
VTIYSEDKNGTLPNGLEGIPSLHNLYLSYFPSLVTLPDWLGTIPALFQSGAFSFLQFQTKNIFSFKQTPPLRVKQIKQ